MISFTNFFQAVLNYIRKPIRPLAKFVRNRQSKDNDRANVQNANKQVSLSTRARKKHEFRVQPRKSSEQINKAATKQRKRSVGKRSAPRKRRKAKRPLKLQVDLTLVELKNALCDLQKTLNILTNPNTTNNGDIHTKRNSCPNINNGTMKVLNFKEKPKLFNYEPQELKQHKTRNTNANATGNPQMHGDHLALGKKLSQVKIHSEQLLNTYNFLYDKWNKLDGLTPQVDNSEKRCQHYSVYYFQSELPKCPPPSAETLGKPSIVHFVSIRPAQRCIPILAFFFF